MRYCRSNPDGSLTQVPHSQVIDDSASLIANELRDIYGHDFGNYSYIKGLLTKATDPLSLANRFVQGVRHRVNQGSRPPNEIYENALTWLESQCN